MNRLGLFLFYDSDGIVDDYVKYLLDDMNQHLSDLCIIVNGELTSEGMKTFEKYSDKIIIRSNKGFDVGAWKDAMIDEYGFEKLEEYDEVILFNDSFFGPVYPFSEMFGEMNKKDLDFWAITVHGDAPDPRNLCPYPFRPRYLQLFFLVFRKEFVKSNEFKKYWQDLPYFENFNDVGYKHQAVFTKHFSDLGFKWAAYVDTGDLEESIEKSTSFHTYNMYDMVKNRRLPVIKRKAFKLPRKFHLIFNNSMDIASTMQFLDKDTDYDVSLIYKYFLRTIGPYELATITNAKEFISKNNLNSDYRSVKKIVVIAQITRFPSLINILNYLKNIPNYIDILFITPDLDYKGYIEDMISLDNDFNVKFIESDNILSSLFCECRGIIDKYDYFCFVNDNKVEIDDYLTVRNAYINTLLENTLASPDYINTIIKSFDEDSNLGLIVPPTFYHGQYFREFSDNYWSNYREVEDLFDKLKLQTKISDDESPLSMGNFFWAKSDALKELFDLDSHFKYNNNVLEKIYPYVAAHHRFYTKTVMTTEHGRNELTNYQYMFNETVNVVNNKSSSIVNLNKTFNVYLSTLRKALINKNQHKQIKKAKSMEASTSWKITKPIRKISSLYKKLFK